MVKQTYTNKEASEYLSVSIRTLFNLRRSGLLKGYKLGNRNYYLKEELDECIRKAVTRTA